MHQATLPDVTSARAAESGLLELLSPPASLYPSFSQLSNGRGRSPPDLTRFAWRSKQNLDFAFLMLQVKSRGKLYLQLEDDVLTKEVQKPFV